MNNHIKAAVIIAFAIVFAMTLSIYFSPFHTCKREQSEYNKRSAASYCARLTSPR